MKPPDPAAARQHRNAALLLLGNALVGVTGFGFWYIVAGWARVPPAELGLGYALISLATLIALVSKGGLDSALIRLVPGAGRRQAPRLLRLATLVGIGAVLLLALVGAATSQAGLLLDQLSLTHWTLVALLAALLAVAWLQDAYLVAVADARYTFVRNLTFSGARLVLPFPLVALAWPYPIPLVWALALVLSLASVAHALRLPPRAHAFAPVAPRELLRTAARNATGGLAEFVPGLVLVPLVLALRGAEQAAYFGIAWAAAALLFLASASISRSALSELVHEPQSRQAATLRRGVAELALVLVPATVALAVVARPLLDAFGPGYAEQGHVAFLLLLASVPFAAPLHLHLALLRATDRARQLVILPGALMALLLLLAPVGAAAHGLAGVAGAWLAATAPFGLYAARQLQRHAQGVNRSDPSVAHRGRADLE